MPGDAVGVVPSAVVVVVAKMLAHVTSSSAATLVPASMADEEPPRPNNAVVLDKYPSAACAGARVSARRRVRVRVFCEISVTTRLQVEKLIGTGRVLRRRAQIRSQILCAVNIHASATDQREHGFLLDQH